MGKYYTCYAHAIAVKKDPKGREYLLCWLDGDEPDKHNPMQQGIPPDQQITPMPIPRQAIAPGSAVQEPGDAGELAVFSNWAVKAGLMQEEEQDLDLGGIFR